ncbi:MAG TPA: twin-arginine translocase TatA/TatE family subunit [Actinomycetota bacterium]|nr:twin-arginine translocase TatA/TatE family subunit [Actinomycetota bacterium]
MFSSVGPTEILVILIIALLVFGPQKLPEVGRSIGRGLREFRRASDEVKEQLLGGLDEDPPTFPPSSPNGAEGETSGTAASNTDGEGSAKLPADGTE